VRKIDLLKQHLSFLQEHNGNKDEIAEIEKKIERSKKGRRSKNKGRSYENDIRDVFNETFPELKMARTPQSGGFQKESSNVDIRGDVSNLNKDVTLLLHLECKNQASWSLPAWMRQSSGDCPKGKYPVVVVHQQQKNENGKRVQEADDFVFLRLKDFLQIVEEGKIIRRNKNEVKHEVKPGSRRFRPVKKS
jgi:hypothetical protein